ncbi:MAG: YihY/virulence factor BrkB family protein [Acidimicrobiales bacterium]|nr:YihY/virulence factor BrkB family protein [Acidimicrobiales bacterium]
MIRRTFAEAARDRITSSAASLAFHWFLAIFPAAIAALGVVGLVGLSAGQLRSLVHGVSVILPAQMSQVIDEALRNPVGGAGGRAEVVVGVLVALWSSVESMSALQVALDVAYEVPSDRSFLRRRLWALPLVAVTIVLGGAAFALLVLGDPVRALLPSSAALAQGAFDGAWEAIRWAGALLLVMVLLSAYYTVGANHGRFRWRWLSAGAVAAAAGWMGASAGFSFYLDNFGHESRTYGAFAGVAVLLLWLFVTAVAVLAGAELNCELARPHPAAAEGGADR